MHPQLFPPTRLPPPYLYNDLRHRDTTRRRSRRRILFCLPSRPSKGCGRQTDMSAVNAVPVCSPSDSGPHSRCPSALLSFLTMYSIRLSSTHSRHDTSNLIQYNIPIVACLCR